MKDDWGRIVCDDVENSQEFEELHLFVSDIEKQGVK